MLFQIVGQSLAHSLLHSTSHLAVAQFRLGLSLELGLSHFHTDDRRETLAEVLTADFNLLLLQFLRNLVVISILLQHTRQSRAETLQVRTTFDGVDVVHIGVDVLAVRRVVHDGHLDGRVLLLSVQINHIVKQAHTGGVDVAHKVLQASLAVEHLLTHTLDAHLSVLVQTHVGQRNLDARVQIGQFPHAVGQNVIFISSGDEDGLVGPELLTSATQFRLAHHLHVVERLALLILLLINLAVAEHLRSHVRRKCVHTTHTHTVQTARHLVGAFVKLTTGMQHRHHHFECAAMLLLVHIHRDATSVVLHGDRVVFVDGHFDVRTEACQRLIDRVIHGFINEMVKTLLADVADIHGGAFSHGLQALQDLDVAGGIVRPVHLRFIHCFSVLFIFSVLRYKVTDFSSCTKIKNKEKFPYGEKTSQPMILGLRMSFFRGIKRSESSFRFRPSCLY